MNSVVKIAKTLRNNWKKTVFAAFALNYGFNYTKDYLEIQELMRVYCSKAAEYGKQPIGNNEEPLTIKVILNPNANKRKAVKDFEKYCAPILNLAGVCVDVIQTESEGHAKELMAEIPGADAVVVAGGDGTLSEVVTGLLRQTDGQEVPLPVGILPLGRSNTVGNRLFPGGSHLEKVHSIADASLAVVERQMKPLDVLKIVTLDDDAANKPVYAVSGIEWGAYRDAESKRDSYWYYGALRKYATYLFNGYKASLNWTCKATLLYTDPCAGCTNCKKPPQRSWYQRIFSSDRTKKLDDSLEATSHCKEIHEKDICTSDFTLVTSNVLETPCDPPKMQIRLGPDSVDYLQFVSEGWKSEKGENRMLVDVIEAKEIEIKPAVESEEEKWFSIDKEAFEVKSIKVTLLPRALNMFCKKANAG